MRARDAELLNGFPVDDEEEMASAIEELGETSPL